MFKKVTAEKKPCLNVVVFNVFCNFILYRYPTANRFYNEDMIDSAFQALINVNTLIEESLNLSNRAKVVIRKVEDEISVSKTIE